MAQKLKILYLVTQSELGGAQRYIFDLAANLSQKFDITVASGGNGELFEELDKKNIKNIKINNLVREISPIKDLLALLKIYRLIREKQPDILHLNSSKTGVLGAIAGKIAGVKKIFYTVHGFVFNEPMPGWKKNLYIWLEKNSAKFKNKLICVSEFDREEGLKRKIAPAKKLVVIHNGIKPNELLTKENAREKLIARYRLPVTGCPVIGTIANFYPTKGLIYFIRAAKIIAEKKPNAQFVIIGDGEERKILEEEIKKIKLADNFQLAGRIKNASKILKAFDIYVCSSVKEGFPYSILEAMSAELPIVTTKVGGVPEIIEDKKNGLLIEPEDPEKIAEAVIKLIEDGQLAKNLSIAAKNDVLNKFNFEKMLQKTIAVYESNQ